MPVAVRVCLSTKIHMAVRVLACSVSFNPNGWPTQSRSVMAEAAYDADPLRQQMAEKKLQGWPHDLSASPKIGQ